MVEERSNGDAYVWPPASSVKPVTAEPSTHTDLRGPFNSSRDVGTRRPRIRHLLSVAVLQLPSTHPFSPCLQVVDVPHSRSFDCGEVQGANSTVGIVNQRRDANERHVLGVDDVFVRVADGRLEELLASERRVISLSHHNVIHKCRPTVRVLQKNLIWAESINETLRDFAIDIRVGADSISRRRGFAVNGCAVHELRRVELTGLGFKELCVAATEVLLALHLEHPLLARDNVNLRCIVALRTWIAAISMIPGGHHIGAEWVGSVQAARALVGTPAGALSEHSPISPP